MQFAQWHICAICNCLYNSETCMFVIYFFIIVWYEKTKYKNVFCFSTMGNFQGIFIQNFAGTGSIKISKYFTSTYIRKKNMVHSKIG